MKRLFALGIIASFLLASDASASYATISIRFRAETSSVTTIAVHPNP